MACRGTSTETMTTRSGHMSNIYNCSESRLISKGHLKAQDILDFQYKGHTNHLVIHNMKIVSIERSHR